MTARQQATAIVPAAGTGSRMCRATPKQYLRVAGASVIEHTLTALLACPFIDRIIVGIAAQDTAWPTLPIAAHARVQSVTGGAHRAATVTNCLLAPPLCDAGPRHWVLVHDAARPCAAPEDIARLWQALRDDECGGLLGIPVRDTIKRADDSGAHALATVARESLWVAQTPQMFRLGILLAALQAARARRALITDEAMAIEQAGGRPRLVPGSARNNKITYPEDLLQAALHLGQRGGV